MAPETCDGNEASSSELQPTEAMETSAGLASSLLGKRKAETPNTTSESEGDREEDTDSDWDKDSFDCLEYNPSDDEKENYEEITQCNSAGISPMCDLEEEVENGITCREFLEKMVSLCVEKYNRRKKKKVKLEQIVRANYRPGGRVKHYITFHATESESPNAPLVEYQAKAVCSEGKTYPILCRPSPPPKTWIGGKSKKQNQQAQAKAYAAEVKKKVEATPSSQPTVEMSFQEILGIVESLTKDWSRDGGKVIGPVINQHDKDICWAISLTRLVQALHNIGLPIDQHLDFAYDELIEHIMPNETEKFALSNLKKPFKHIAEKGIMKVPINKRAKARGLGKRVTKNLELHKDINAAFIQEKLDTSPVALILEVNKKFSYLGKEIYYLPKKKASHMSGLHIMLLFGYGTTKEGELYFIGQNSHGEKWGCKGYARIIIHEKCDIVCQQ